MRTLFNYAKRMPRITAYARINHSAKSMILQDIFKTCYNRVVTCFEDSVERSNNGLNIHYLSQSTFKTESYLLNSLNIVRVRLRARSIFNEFVKQIFVCNLIVCICSYIQNIGRSVYCLFCHNMLNINLLKKTLFLCRFSFHKSPIVRRPLILSLIWDKRSIRLIFSKSNMFQ